MSADCVTSRPLAALPNAGLAFDVGREAPRRVGEVSDAPSMLTLSIHDRLEAVEAEWRSFEREADCTPFQTFDWLLRWQRHIGTREGVQPVIAVGSFAGGQTAIILPLAIDRSGGARRLCWLGQDLNDYNAPLVARDFSQRIPAERFRAVWKELRVRMQREPLFRHDWIELEKMPQLVGGQLNPFFALALATNPSGAHFAELGADWKKFYAVQTLVGDAAPRPIQAQAAGPIRRGRLCGRRRYGRGETDARNPDGAKAPAFRAPRHSRHV